MLDPRDRQHLLEMVKPEQGFKLTDAIGTCYSMDLLAVLTVPLAMTFFEWEGSASEESIDPLAMLESLRRQSKHIDIYCQAGQIHVPKKAHRMFAYLEKMIHECKSPYPAGSFHPKVWVLRFIDNSGVIEYRTLCLSRNLTYDQSWDTALVLRGALKDRERAISRSRPLADFVRALPTFANRAVSKDTSERALWLADELERVEWECPEPFESLEFSPLGLDGYRHFPLQDDIQRLLIVSPFLSESLLTYATRDGSKHVLISSPPDLLELSKAGLKPFGDKIYTLAAQSIPSEDEGQSTENHPILEDLNGLHAKILIADYGWKSTVVVGSANATTAAYGNGEDAGRNIEFCIALTGKKSVCGVEVFLNGPDGVSGVQGLLQKWSVPEDFVPDEIEKKLERELQIITDGLINAALEATVTKNESGDNYSLRLFSKTSIKFGPNISVSCWPASLSAEAHRIVVDSGKPICAIFDPVSFEGITSFFGFRVKAQLQNRLLEQQFVLNVLLSGVPADREERLLRTLLQDKAQVLRFILFLLADECGDPTGLLSLDGSDGKGNESSVLGMEGAIFETLMKTFHRAPERLDHVKRLVDDLVKSPETLALLPDGFLDIWKPILEARLEHQEQ